MLGAFAAGGAVVGLARTFVTDLGGGDPGYGLLFGTVFLGLALGMFLGPRLLPDFSRRRLFGLALGGAGLALAVLALIPNLVVAVLVTLVIGAFAGVSWVTGYTLIGLEVTDDLRGRTFAFVQTMVRVVLVLVLAVAPLLAAAIGQHQIEVTEAMTLTYNGAAFVFLGAGLLAAGLGFVSYRHMDDRRGVPLGTDIAAAFASEPVGRRASGPREGFFIALEGGEGAGKSTQAQALRGWLESLGHDVVVTFEPGATEVGRRLRSVLLDHPEAIEGGDGATPAHLSPRTEALLFAADRAEHVATVVRPALELGHVVITDRYLDSSVAYQGAGRDLAGAEVARLSRWATDGLQPHLTVLLDVPAEAGLARVDAPDRLESEPRDFHDRVRERFLELARRGGSRYLVVDGTRPADEITETIKARLEPVLPLSATAARRPRAPARGAGRARPAGGRGAPAGGGAGPGRGRGARQGRGSGRGGRPAARRAGGRGPGRGAAGPRGGRGCRARAAGRAARRRRPAGPRGARQAPRPARRGTPAAQGADPRRARGGAPPPSARARRVP